VNTLTHGDGSGPVRVAASGTAGALEPSVSNSGRAIPEATRRLFLPFTRAEDSHGWAGLGLGLYIASEIARAHGARSKSHRITSGRTSRFGRLHSRLASRIFRPAKTTLCRLPRHCGKARGDANARAQK
jgi:K+-sensing histidine kinase KdpD